MKTAKREKLRTIITEKDGAPVIAMLHQAWRRDMAKALGAVETQNAAVERMEALHAVNKLRAGEE